MTFARRFVPALDREVHRLGLAMNYGIDGKGFDEGVERGMNYFFWTSLKTGHLREPLRAALKRDRSKMVVAAGPTLGFFGGNVRRGLERTLRDLDTEYVDAFHLFWLGVGSALTDGTIDALVKLKEEGKIRKIAISIHDRVRAGKLALESPIDLFMIRYNAAHPGAERDIFPHLEKRKPAVVAYTATSWRKLLKAPRGWNEPPMTAGDCYRFCLSSPHVDVTLTGPKSSEQLRESLDALDRGLLTADEAQWMRAFGARVHGGKTHAPAPAHPASAP